MKKTKKLLSLLLSVIMLLSITAGLDYSAFAGTTGYCGDNVRYSYNSSSRTLTISGNGKMTNYYNSYSVPWYDWWENMRTVVINYGVTTIGDYAFSHCDIRNVTIPSSVTSIGHDAFAWCGFLTSEGITIPNSVKRIGCGAFYKCHNLRSITIPNGVTTIEDSTFQLSGLQSITIPNGVTTIGERAFGSCDFFSVTIPNSVTSIGDLAFSWCDNLLRITIPDGVTSIGRGVFHQCDSLASVTIPDSIKRIEKTAFGDCQNLANVYYGGTIEQWNKIDFYRDPDSFDAEDGLKYAQIHCKPRATSLKSLTPTAYGFKADWTKVDETTGYQIQYSTNSDFSGAALVYGGATNTLTNTVTGRACGAKYYVRVRTYITFADGSRIWGDWSNSKSITTDAKPKATTMNVAPVVNGFKVSWSKVSETTGYQIEYSTKSDFSGSALVYGGATNTLSKTITGRAAGTKYYVRVRTYKTLADGTRVWGNWSQAKAVTTNVAQATVKSVSGVTKGFKTTWNKIGGVTGYQIQYSTRKDFQSAATVYAGDKNAVEKTITGRAKNTTYYIRVRGYKNNGNGNYVWGAWSAAKTVKTK